jgi:hypothetical protein
LERSTVSAALAKVKWACSNKLSGDPGVYLRALAQGMAAAMNSSDGGLHAAVLIALHEAYGDATFAQKVADQDGLPAALLPDTDLCTSFNALRFVTAGQPQAVSFFLLMEYIAAPAGAPTDPRTFAAENANNEIV